MTIERVRGRFGAGGPNSSAVAIAPKPALELELKDNDEVDDESPTPQQSKADGDWIACDGTAVNMGVMGSSMVEARRLLDRAPAATARPLTS